MRKLTGISMLVFVLMFSTSVFAQEVPTENDSPEMGVEVLQQMPVEETQMPTGEIYLQRTHNEVERIVGYVAGEPETFSEEEQLWIEYLEKPHPSVSTMQQYFQEAAQEFGVPVELLEAIGQVESNWTQIGQVLIRAGA
jgi:hypothetical protein